MLNEGLFYRNAAPIFCKGSIYFVTTDGHLHIYNMETKEWKIIHPETWGKRVHKKSMP